MRNTEIIEAMLTELSVKETARKVYVDLLVHGATTARVVAQRLSIPRSSVYDHIEPLLMKGLVIQKEKGGKTYFTIHDVQDLGRLVSEREDELTLLRARFDHAKKTLPILGDVQEPTIKFFEGTEGLKSLLKEMLWDAGVCIQTVWPYTAMLEVLGRDTLETFNAGRVKQKIRIESIWIGTPKAKGHIWHGADEYVTRKIAPKHFAVPIGYSIYGNKVAFISSTAEQYGFIVHSAEFAQLMRMQFELLWNISTPS